MPDTRRSLTDLQALWPDNTTGDISPQDGRDALISMHPEKLSQQGTLASIPASARVTGDLYRASDSFYRHRWNGSAWVPEGPTWQFTEPVDGDFAWINQGDATKSTANGGVILYNPAQGAGSHNWRIRKKTAPSTPYTIKTAMKVGWNPNIAGQVYFALLWRDNSGNLITHGGYFNSSPSGSVDTTVFVIYKWTSPTAFSAAYLTSWGQVPTGLIWLGIEDNGTDRKCLWSMDGYTWFTLHTVSRTDFLTPTEIGFALNTSASGSDGSLSLLHWAES